MNIGVLKERKKDENRVALQPKQVKVLKENGHQVYLEEHAGVNSGYSNTDYEQCGAKIAEKGSVLQDCQLILKVKAPLADEYDDYNEAHTLFTYLHFDENISPENIHRMIKNGFLGIAYEWVQQERKYPLLEPMSKLTGYLFAQIAANLCARHKGVLCGKYEDDLPGASILIVGVGTIGQSVLKYAIDNNMQVFILDKNIGTLNERLNARFKTAIDYISKYNLKTVAFASQNPRSVISELEQLLPQMDIVINCAVRRPDLPKAKMEYLISRAMVVGMQKNSVICDATACDKDLIETAISTESLYDIEVIEGVIHYNCDHLPSYVGNTATDLLTNATFPYVLELANLGIIEAIKANAALRRGVSCYHGKLTHQYSAEKKKLEYVDFMGLV